MKLVLCLDDYNGYSFNHRRQTKDKGVRLHLVSRIAEFGTHLHINYYSEKSFVTDGIVDDCVVCDGDDFLNRALQEDEWALSENEDVGAYLEAVDELIIYRWNRTYPYDLSVDNVFFDRFTVAEKEKVAARSHENVEYYRYVRRDR